MEFNVKWDPGPAQRPPFHVVQVKLHGIPCKWRPDPVQALDFPCRRQLFYCCRSPLPPSIVCVDRQADKDPVKPHGLAHGWARLQHSGLRTHMRNGEHTLHCHHAMRPCRSQRPVPARRGHCGLAKNPGGRPQPQAATLFVLERVYEFVADHMGDGRLLGVVDLIHR